MNTPTALIRTLPEPLAIARTGSRAARVSAFTLEVWSRLLVDGPTMSSEERARELSWVAENMCALHGLRPRVHGQLPRGPALLVANHMSYFDPMIVASLAPCTAIAKHEVASWPCVGELCRRLGVLYVSRASAASGARVLREMMRAFERGVSVLVFPEGTTTRGDRVLPFKRGSFGAALHAGVPIVPVALRYETPHAAWVGNDMFLPHYMRSIAKAYTRVSVDLLPALSHGRTDTASALAERARTAITEVLQRRARASAPGMSALSDGWSALPA